MSDSSEFIISYSAFEFEISVAKLLKLWFLRLILPPFHSNRDIYFSARRLRKFLLDELSKRENKVENEKGREMKRK